VPEVVKLGNGLLKPVGTPKESVFAGRSVFGWFRSGGDASENLHVLWPRSRSHPCWMNAKHTIRNHPCWMNANHATRNNPCWTNTKHTTRSHLLDEYSSMPLVHFP
jgi:hypothetical protein